jgi:hypothetical protein
LDDAVVRDEKLIETIFIVDEKFHYATELIAYGCVVGFFILFDERFQIPGLSTVQHPTEYIEKYVHIIEIQPGCWALASHLSQLPRGEAGADHEMIILLRRSLQFKVIQLRCRNSNSGIASPGTIDRWFFSFTIQLLRSGIRSRLEGSDRGDVCLRGAVLQILGEKRSDNFMAEGGVAAEFQGAPSELSLPVSWP